MGIKRAARALQPRSKAKTTVARGSTGYDNARENIDPRIITKELLTHGITLGGTRRTTWPTGISDHNLLNNLNWSIAGHNFDVHIAPTVDNAWTMGTAAKKWKDVYCGTLNYTTLNPAISPGGPRSRTLVVAASDSEDDTGADYTCDGTDDEVQINAAITALSGHGGTVMLLDGTYTLGASITMNQTDVMLKGQGSGTIITTASSMNMIAVSSTFCEVCDLRVTGTNTPTYRGIYITGNDNKVTNCKLDTLYYGVQISNDDRCIISNCFFRSCTYGFATNGDGNIVDGCTIDTCQVNQVHGATATAINNTFDSSTLSAGQYSIVIGNTFYLSNNACLMSNYSSVIGNTFDSCGSYAVRVNGTHCSVVGNCFEGCGGAWASIYVAQDHANITGNSIYDDRSDNGAIMLLSKDYCVVSNNLIDKCDRYAILLSGTVHSSVTGNVIRDCSEDADDTYSGIRLQSTSTYNNVSNNNISAGAANKHDYGIEEAAAADNYNVITGNIITDAQTASILVQGADTEEAHNIG